MPQNIPIACDLTVFSADERAKHEATTAQMLASRQEVVEIPDGYGFRYSGEAANVQLLTEFILGERRCCPFFTFTLEIRNPSDSIWLRLTGSQEIKAFLKAEFGG